MSAVTGVLAIAVVAMAISISRGKKKRSAKQIHEEKIYDEVFNQ